MTSYIECETAIEGTIENLRDELQFDKDYVLIDENGNIETDCGFTPEVTITCTIDEGGWPTWKDEPEVYGEGWTAVAGLSGQHAYNGAMFHPSEFVSDGMLSNILESPGYWAISTVNELHDHEPTEDCDGEDPLADGWVLLHKEA